MATMRLSDCGAALPLCPARPRWRFAAATALIALAAGCSLWRADFEAPAEPMAQPPATRAELAEALTDLAPAPASFNAKLSVTVQGAGLKGKHRLTLYGLYAGPQRMKFKASGSAFVGGLFQMTHQGDEVALHFQKEGEFYRGPARLLDTRPDLLMGFEPRDVVRALLVQHEAVEAMRAIAPDTPPDPDPESPRHWRVADPAVDARLESYRLRRADGLVDRVDVFDATGRRKLTVRYREYARYDGPLYPRRFEMDFYDTGLRMEAEVERVRENPTIRPGAFSLRAPGALEARPLTDWIASQPRRPMPASPPARKED